MRTDDILRLTLPELMSLVCDEELLGNKRTFQSTGAMAEFKKQKEAEAEAFAEWFVSR